MTNKSFGKLENGALYYAPLPLVINGENIWTNVEKVYNEQGYYVIERTQAPTKEGYYYTYYWEMGNNKIVQHWEEHEEPKSEETVTETELQAAIQEGVNSIDS